MAWAHSVRLLGNYMQLFGQRRVIPIWATDAIPSAFDMTEGIGGARFDPDTDLDRQARSIADVCGRKLDAQKA